jgi:hypothetical protein
MVEPLKWYDHNADNLPWIKALAEVRSLACREGWSYHHVQGNHRLDRSVCGIRSGRSQLLPEQAVCTENLIRVDEVMESPKLAE